MPSFKFRKIFVLQIWGKKGVKMGFFKVFSKSIRMISFHLLGKEDNTSLYMCAKFEVQENNFSPDMGSKGVKKGGFRGFLIN